MDRYIAQENIKHFSELLENDLDPTLRKMVLRLLSIEKSKLGALLAASEFLTQLSKTRSHEAPVRPSKQAFNDPPYRS